MYYGGDLVSTGLLTIGDLTSFLLYTVYVGGASIGKYALLARTIYMDLP